MIATLLFLMLGGALANRHRGGWIGTGHTQLARLDFALAIAAFYAATSEDWQGALVVIPLTWLGCLAGQGNDQGDNTPLKILGLMGSALCNMAGVVAVAYWARHGFTVDWDWHLVALPAAMLGKPVSYRLGRYLPMVAHFPGLPQWGFARGTTEWGEILFGAVEGAVVFLATLPL